MLSVRLSSCLCCKAGLTVSELAGALLQLLQVFQPGEFNKCGVALKCVPSNGAPVLMPQAPRPFLCTHSFFYFHIIQLDRLQERK